MRVELELERDVVLHPDATLRIANIGFMGEKFLALEPGTAPGRYDHRKPIPAGSSRASPR